MSSSPDLAPTFWFTGLSGAGKSTVATLARDRLATMSLHATIIDGDDVRDRLMLHLERAGIETRHLMPLLGQPIYRKLFGEIESEYPVARRLAASGFYVGCHQGLVDEDLEYIAEHMTEFFDGD